MTDRAGLMLSKDYELFFFSSAFFLLLEIGGLDLEGVMNVNMNVMTSTLTLSAVITIRYAEVEWLERE